MPLSRSDPTHQERFKAVLVALATLHMKDPAKELDKPRLQLYWRSLEQYDIEHIEAAGRHLIDESNYFPKPKHFHAVLRRIVKKRTGTTLQPTDGIWCEWCDDLGLSVWWHGEDGEQPARQVRFLDFRAAEIKRRPPATPVLQVMKRKPRHTWKACTCRNSNPNYQARQKGRDIPPPSSIEDGDYDPNQWSHEEASTALARYAPAQQRGMDW
jgi:hypothetical protein